MSSEETQLLYIRAGMTHQRRLHKLVDLGRNHRFVMLFIFPNDGGSQACWKSPIITQVLSNMRVSRKKKPFKTRHVDLWLTLKNLFFYQHGLSFAFPKGNWCNYDPTSPDIWIGDRGKRTSPNSSSPWAQNRPADSRISIQHAVLPRRRYVL